MKYEILADIRKPKRFVIKINGEKKIQIAPYIFGGICHIWIAIVLNLWFLTACVCCNKGLYLA